MKRFLIVPWLLVFIVSCGGISPRETAAPAGSTPLITFVFDDGNDTDYLVGREIFRERERSPARQSRPIGSIPRDTCPLIRSGVSGTRAGRS
jgi:hypothetical protein